MWKLIYTQVQNCVIVCDLERMGMGNTNFYQVIRIIWFMGIM